MVGVRVHRAVEAEGEDDLRLVVADALDEHCGGLGEVRELKLGVLIVQQLAMGDVEDLAGGGELGPAHLAEVPG